MITKSKLFLGLILISLMGVGMVSGASTLEIENYYGSIDPCNNSDNYQIVSDSLNITDAIRLDLLGGLPPTYENFTEGWVEVVGGKLDQTETRASWTDLLRTDEGQVHYSNRGTLGALGGSAYFRLNVSEITTNYDGTTLMYPILFVEGATYPDYGHIVAGNYDAFGLRVISENGQGEDYRLAIVEAIDGDQFASGMTDPEAMTVGELYYVNLTLSGDVVTCSVYEDEWITLVETWTHTLDGGAGTMNDLYLTTAHDASANPRSSSGYVEYLTFEEAGGGYASTGYVQSLELTGNGTITVDSFCINATIPTGSSVEVRFNDNSSWTAWMEIENPFDFINLRQTMVDVDSFTYEIRLNSSGQVTPTVYRNRVLVVGETGDTGGLSWGISFLGAVVSALLGSLLYIRRA